MTAYCNECGGEMPRGYSSVCRNCRNAREAKELAKFKAKLAREYGVVGNPKFEKCFELAWSHGHSSGYSEVRNYFSDFVELIK